MSEPMNKQNAYKHEIMSRIKIRNVGEKCSNNKAKTSCLNTTQFNIYKNN